MKKRKKEKDTRSRGIARVLVFAGFSFLTKSFPFFWGTRCRILLFHHVDPITYTKLEHSACISLPPAFPNIYNSHWRSTIPNVNKNTLWRTVRAHTSYRRTVRCPGSIARRIPEERSVLHATSSWHHDTLHHSSWILVITGIALFFSCVSCRVRARISRGSFATLVLPAARSSRQSAASRRRVS